MIYSIPEQNMDALVNKLSRIRNKCNKYGCDFHMSIKKAHYEKQFDEHNLYVGDIRMFDIEVSGTAVINNWAFLLPWNTLNPVTLFASMAIKKFLLGPTLLNPNAITATLSIAARILTSSGMS